MTTAIRTPWVEIGFGRPQYISSHTSGGIESVCRQARLKMPACSLNQSVSAETLSILILLRSCTLPTLLLACYMLCVFANNLPSNFASSRYWFSKSNSSFLIPDVGAKQDENKSATHSTPPHSHSNTRPHIHPQPESYRVVTIPRWSSLATCLSHRQISGPRLPVRFPPSSLSTCGTHHHRPADRTSSHTQ